MIEQISLSNFRIFDSKTFFDFKPITVLTGPNNSGKSTLIKALKILVESSQNSQLLYLMRSSTDTNYISPDEIFSKKGKNKSLSFELKLKVPFDTLKLDLKDRKKSHGVKKELFEKWTVNIEYKELNANNNLYSSSEQEPIVILSKLAIKNASETIFDYCIDETNDEQISFITAALNFECFIKNNFEYFLNKNNINGFVKKYFLDATIEKKIHDIILKRVQFLYKSVSYQKDETENVFELKILAEYLNFLFDESENHHITYLEDNYDNIFHPSLLNEKDNLSLNLTAQFKEYLNENDLKEFVFIMKNAFHDINILISGYIKNLIETICTELNNLDHYIAALNRNFNTAQISRINTDNFSKKIFNLLDLNKIHGSSIDWEFIPDKIPRDAFNEFYNLKRNYKHQKFGFVEEVIRKIFHLGVSLYATYNKFNQKYDVFIVQQAPVEIQKKYLTIIEKQKNNEQLTKSDINFLKKAKITVAKENILSYGSGVYHLILLLIEIELAIISGGYLEEIDFFDSEDGTDDLAREYTKKKSNHVILIEEPEISLHPNFQSKLADVLAFAHKKYGVRFIVETHSEYLLRKLQYCVANKKHDYPLDKEDVVIYYLNSKEEDKKKRKLEITIDERGNLSQDFGPGFYDEAINWKFELLKIKSFN